MKIILTFVSILLFTILIVPAPLLLTSCGPDDSADATCIGVDAPCEGFSWSFVDPDTYENLMGTDGQLIHPDTVVILNLTQDTMFHRPHYSQFSKWWSISFSPGPYQELNCFNQCVLDSAFSRFYYVYVGNQDWDTLEVHFPANTTRATLMEVYFNGEDGSKPDDRPANTPSSTYWFQKK